MWQLHGGVMIARQQLYSRVDILAEEERMEMVIVWSGVKVSPWAMVSKWLMRYLVLEQPQIRRS